eukprot:TRINITY_DN7163_c0_g1_i1.p1 TRINITY_DN7163_c0_g1~~TRINITY_DN7163_c0_g1_i1.p1  ORF type:complete len:255 (-),score=49.00 TRINITY_DN7163_c0_g1_i1:273-1037(-)
MLELELEKRRSRGERDSSEMKEMYGYIVVALRLCLWRFEEKLNKHQLYSGFLKLVSNRELLPERQLLKFARVHSFLIYHLPGAYAFSSFSSHHPLEDFMVSQEEVLEWLCRTDCNSFSIFEKDYCWGVCLNGSLFNHSCSPNVTYLFTYSPGGSDKEEQRSSDETAASSISTYGDLSSFPGVVINFKALEDIEACQELNISYLDLNSVDTAPFFRRTSHLKKKFHFDCYCVRCTFERQYMKPSDEVSSKTDNVK